MRDYLQVHVGQLSLEESKKSIEVSKAALAKNRQVKLGVIHTTITTYNVQDLLLTKCFHLFGTCSHHPCLRVLADKLGDWCIRYECPGIDCCAIICCWTLSAD